MRLFNSLKTEDKWLLAIIYSVPYVEGRTRLQKFGIFSFYEVLGGKEFFEDWRADSYGGFSPRLAASLAKLESRGYVQSSEVITEHGSAVNRYALTEKGKDSIRPFAAMHSSKLGEIRSIVSSYFQQPLMALLRDVYERYPDLTINSKIKADVNNTESIPCRDPEYGIWSDEKPAAPSFIASSQHVLGDEDFREQLARSVGFEKAPDLDPQSFDRIKGILSEEIDAERFDSEELVKEVRGC